MRYPAMTNDKWKMINGKSNRLMISGGAVVDAVWSDLDLMGPDSFRGSADVDMGAGRGSGDRPANRDKRYTLRSEIADQSLPFGAVRMYGDVNGFAVIETQAIVGLGLTERADGK